MFENFQLEGSPTLPVRKGSFRERFGSICQFPDFELEEIEEKNSKSERNSEPEKGDAFSEEGKSIEESSKSPEESDEGTQTMFEKWKKKHPKREMLKVLRDICLEKSAETSKVQKMVECVRSYLFEFEMVYFDEIAAKASFSPEELIQAVEKGFKRKIGGLAFEARRQKIVTYF